MDGKLYVDRKGWRIIFKSPSENRLQPISTVSVDCER